MLAWGGKPVNASGVENPMQLAVKPQQVQMGQRLAHRIGHLVGILLSLEHDGLHIRR